MSTLPANPTLELAFSSTLHDRAERRACIEQEVLALFDLLQNRLLRYALSFGLATHDGEDVVQETFLALFRHLCEGKSRENLHGWLFRVTHNLALKRRSKNLLHAISTSEIEFEIVDSAQGPEEHLLFKERHGRLQSVLGALSLRDQSCLRLRAEGLGYREIASTLGISLGSVSASLTRSLARLRRAEARSHV